MASLNAISKLAFVDLYTGDTTQPSWGGVGQLQWGSNGKAFRYSLVGISALVKGNLIQSSDFSSLTTYENMAVGTAAVAGQNYLQITNGTSTITSQQFEGGTISVYTAGTVAIGDEYTITAVTGTLTTGGALNVYLDRPLRYAYTTSAKVTMKRNPWSGVIQAPITTATGMIVGAAVYEIPAAQYGWIQTHGVCSVLSSNGTFAPGSDLGVPCADAAGAVTVYAAGSTHQRVGVTMHSASANAHAIPIFLQID